MIEIGCKLVIEANLILAAFFPLNESDESFSHCRVGRNEYIKLIYKSHFYNSFFPPFGFHYSGCICTPGIQIYVEVISVSIRTQDLIIKTQQFVPSRNINKHTNHYNSHKQQEIHSIFFYTPEDDDGEVSTSTSLVLN